jgi:hypothetical protein
VERPTTYSCCRLERIDKNTFMLGTLEIPSPFMAVRLNEGMRIVGAVDLEIKPLPPPEASPFEGVRGSGPDKGALLSEADRVTVASLLKRSRRRAGLTFRVASAMTRQIADSSGDPRYFVAASSLSDYEANERSALRLHKVLAICAVYGIDFRSLAHAAAPPSRSVSSPTPEELPQHGPAEASLFEARGGFVARILEFLEEAPFFLGDVVPSALGRPQLSVRDLFWTEERETGVLPRGTFLLIVNRLAKKPPPFAWKPYKNHALFLLLHRRGDYSCSFCSSIGGSTVMHGPRDAPPQPRVASEYEVVGRIIGIVRKLGAHG